MVLSTAVSLGWFFAETPASADDERGQGAGVVNENGNLNGDNTIDLSDPIYLLLHLFRGGPEPEPCPAGVNGGDSMGLPDTGAEICWNTNR